MTASTVITPELRRAFADTAPLLVRVTQDGFLVDGDVQPELVGHVTRADLLRKLFQDGKLLCNSTDGVTARNGTVCAECRHPRCRPQIRLALAGNDATHIIDLGTTSARNLFAVADEAQRDGATLDGWLLRLTVQPREGWGEVHFERLF